MSAVVRRRSLVGVGAALAAAVPLLLVGGLMTARVQGEYLNKARVRLREAEVRAAQADEAYRAQRVLLARESRISTFTADRPDLESVLRRLTALTPPAVVYKSLELQEQGAGDFSLHLEGESVATSGADAQASFNAFMGALRACDFAVMEGEPRRMLIRPGEASDPGERTQFSLDLQLGSKAPVSEVSHEDVAAQTP
jgi:Tfp pilus assembly protein PilN